MSLTPINEKSGFRYSTESPAAFNSDRQLETKPRSRWKPKHTSAVIAAVVLAGLIAGCGYAAFGPSAGTPNSLSAQGALTLAVFAVAIWLWIFSPVSDTYVALGACLVLVLMGVLPETQLFSSLGEDTIWLLLAAFVIAAGITATGLATRAAAWIDALRDKL